MFAVDASITRTSANNRRKRKVMERLVCMRRTFQWRVYNKYNWKRFIMFTVDISKRLFVSISSYLLCVFIGQYTNAFLVKVTIACSLCVHLKIYLAETNERRTVDENMACC
jgi:hypothetical protein